MADHLLIAAAQLAAKLETTSGTAETLTATEVALKPDISGFTYSPNTEMIDLPQVGEDLGASISYPSGYKGSLAFGVGFKTAGAVGTEPAIGRYLEACGFKLQTVLTTTAGAPSPSGFAAGETYSATGGKTGIIDQAYTGAGTLRYIVTSGGALANTNVVTCGSNTATCSATQATYAVKASPRSSGFKTMTIQRGVKNYAGTSAKDYLYRLCGAMGNATITADPNGFLRFAGDFQGVEHFQGDGSLFVGPTFEASLPPKFQNSTWQLGGITLVPDTVTIDFGNEVVMDPDPTVGGGANGYLCARVTKRLIKVSTSYLRTPTTTWDDAAKFKAGTTFAWQMICGTTPNMIEFTAPKCQFSDISYGDRSGLETSSISFACVKDDTLADNDFSIYFR